MESFSKLTSKVVLLDRSNVDTDAIIPKQFLKSINKDNLGDNCFDQWRYLDNWFLGIDNSKRPLNPNFALNQLRYKDSKILMTKKNFGCGSSREHAIWALYSYGFKVIIAISFADIFFNNCYKNGLLPIVLDEKIVDNLFNDVFNNEGYSLTIDLNKQLVITADNKEFSFDITNYRKYCLLNGLDEIGLTLLYKDKIKEFERKHFLSKPWLK